MAQFYSDESREQEDTALPDAEVFQLTAAEVAAMDEDTIAEYMKRPEYRMARMNSRTCEAMLDAIVADQELKGGWFYWYCQPGCLPDSDPIGPFTTEQEAIDDARGSNE